MFLKLVKKFVSVMLMSKYCKQTFSKARTSESKFTFYSPNSWKWDESELAIAFSEKDSHKINKELKIIKSLQRT